MKRRRAWAGAAALAVVGAAGTPAQAWDAATTHAGLTQRAALASSLHAALVQRLGRPLGLFEPIVLDGRRMEQGAFRRLAARLGALDPAGGYRPRVLPDGRLQATAIGWLTAGSVIAEAPPNRGRDHFFDPRTRTGLHSRAGSDAGLELRETVDDDDGLRKLATGTLFDGNGRPALAALTDPNDPLSLPSWQAALQAAVGAPDPADRDRALATALLALGGVLATLEDMGEPAHVRNDLAAFRSSTGLGAWDRGSAFERHVADAIGRNGVPDPAAPGADGKPSHSVTRPSLFAFFTASDDQGLADRTQRRFFSAGTVPRAVPVTPASTPRDVFESARRSLALPAPALPRLELREPGVHYVVRDGRRVLAYERRPDRVEFFLDAHVFDDVSSALLPEVGAYATGLIEHVTKPHLTIAVEDGRARVRAVAWPGARVAGELRVYAEDGSGRRRELDVRKVASAAADAIADLPVPSGAVALAASLSGGEPVDPVVAVGSTSMEQGEARAKPAASQPAAPRPASPDPADPR